MPGSVKLNCKTCGKEFSASPAEARKRKHCSRACNPIYQRKHSKEFIAEVRRLWETGETYTIIGKILGVTRGTIAGISNRYGFPPHPRSNNRIHAEERAEAIKTLQKLGKTNKQTAELLGLTEGSVKGIVRSKWFRETMAILRPKYIWPTNACLYPFGHPGDADFAFCGEPLAVHGQPYCSFHAQVCYIPAKLEKLKLEEMELEAAE